MLNNRNPTPIDEFDNNPLIEAATTSNHPSDKIVNPHGIDTVTEPLNVPITTLEVAKTKVIIGAFNVESIASHTSDKDSIDYTMSTNIEFVNDGTTTIWAIFEGVSTLPDKMITYQFKQRFTVNRAWESANEIDQRLKELLYSDIGKLFETHYNSWSDTKIKSIPTMDGIVIITI